MSTSKFLSKIKKTVNKNQNTHRLTGITLIDLDKLPKDLQDGVWALLNSKGDLAQVSLGVLIWAVLSANKAVFILSRDDMQELVNVASSKANFKKFDLNSARSFGGSKMSIYGQLTGLMVSDEYFKILQASKKGSKIPAVIELIEPELLKHVPIATEEARQQVINATSKQVSKSSILQEDNTTSIQGYNTTRHSAQQSAQEDAQQSVECFQDVVDESVHVVERESEAVIRMRERFSKKRPFA